MRIVVGDSPGRGRGVFARVPFRTGELIEECPVITFDRESRALIDRTALYGYYFYWGPGGDLGAIALGFGSLYNHSSMPNASFERHLNSSSIVFRALCPITAGDEPPMTIRVIHVSILHFGSTRYSGSTNGGKCEMGRLAKMIAERYDNEILMSLKGEIFFDLELSKADVDMARSVYQGVIHRPLPAVVYLPCSGTLRHVPALLGSGVKKVVAVDLSFKSLTSGRAFFGLSSLESVEIYHQDIRQIETFVPPGGFDLAIMLGNSLGDATDLNSHNECIEAIARSLSDHGVVLFDYVSDRYCSGLATAPTPTTSMWPERLAVDDGTEVKVTDKRSREYQAVCPGIGILRFQGEVAAESGEILTAYTYEKLVVADGILIEQFRRAGLDLRSMGSVAHLSPYHRRRVDTFDDLGMLGTPNHLYLARKV